MSDAECSLTCCRALDNMFSVALVWSNIALALSLWEGWSSLDELELSGGTRILEDMELSEENGILSKNSSSLDEL